MIRLCYSLVFFLALMVTPDIGVRAEAASPALAINQKARLSQETCGQFRVVFANTPKVMKKITIKALSNVGFTSTGQQLYSVYVSKNYQGLVVPFCLTDRSKEALVSINGSYKGFKARRLDARFNPSEGLWAAAN